MHGDVDQIEALLPELLCYFIGSGNGNYAKEVFEFLQLITHECTPALRAAILKHGLVVNKLGCANGFYPIGQRQEFNNAGIKNYGSPPQNSSWEQYGKISSVIPFFMNIVEHITSISRSHIRKNPKRNKDVKALTENHLKQRLHQTVPGQTLDCKDKVKDVCLDGMLAIQDRRILEDYHEKCDIYCTASSSKQNDTDISTRSNNPVPLPTGLEVDMESAM
ncbi:hypothetical protein FRC09_004164 [Ceratobasidium sp. 395]|nr:hypothetical protein FRC09_004164 [Ceratobasidium sp. 395]